MNGEPHLINRETLRVKLKFSWKDYSNTAASLQPELLDALCVGLRLAAATLMHTSVLKQIWSFLLFFSPGQSAIPYTQASGKSLRSTNPSQPYQGSESCIYCIFDYG